MTDLFDNQIIGQEKTLIGQLKMGDLGPVQKLQHILKTFIKPSLFQVDY